MMNSRVLFGSFVPVDSVLHRLDPRLKLVTCFWYVVIIFFAMGPLTYLLLVAMLGAMIGLSKVLLKMYWAGLKPLLWVIGLTIAIQVLFSSGGHVYWHWGLMAITSGGINQALVILARFILIVLASTVLTATTPPLRLADAIESLMKPLKKIKVPVNQIAMMISIALRFIPTMKLTRLLRPSRPGGWISPPGVSTPGSSAWCQSWCPCLSGPSGEPRIWRWPWRPAATIQIRSGPATVN